ncbi:D-2-hydroxyacid dehydrogenase [Halococcus sp. PRR34]|uniref:D-2-hydroxyacid dehydrogenase n=1 Tax=Halococcus sp. PRR34 TaxID=3020830 RepID=UPI002361D1D3|nr:D-2-hydroxyacid dehydrogenase [Halococcus sp. PRR34]
MSPPKLLITHTVDPGSASSIVPCLESALPTGALERARTPAESRTLLSDADAIVTLSLSDNLLAATESVGWVQALSAGVDHYDLDALRERDIAFTNVSGVHAEQIAEQVLGYILMFERRIHESIQQQQHSVWKRVEGGEVRGKTLGIIGVGSIGTRVAELGSALGMQVIGTKRDPKTAPEALETCYSPDDFHEVVCQSSYLVLACPLTETTNGMIGIDEIRMMPTDAILVNIARGEIVDQDALIRGLHNGWIRGAGLDVFETEPLPQTSSLWDLPNVVVTPHMAGSSPRKAERWCSVIAENYRKFANNNRNELVNRVV